MKKVVLITGASAGMGKETAKLLADCDYKVYGVARRVDKMQDLERSGVNVLHMDVANEQSMSAVVSRIVEKEGKIDVLINNAGFGSYGAVEDVPMDDARYQMEVNLFGLARMIQLVLPHMRDQQYGKIVNVTSIGGKMAAPLGGWYHASKFAVEGLSDSLRLEVKPFGIDVIVIEPGGVKTEWGGIAFDHAKKISGDTAYKDLTEKAEKIFSKTTDNNIEPVEIAELIKEAIEAKQPKTRYVKGYLAKPILTLKKWLSDSMFDKILMSQLK